MNVALMTPRTVDPNSDMGQSGNYQTGDDNPADFTTSPITDDTASGPTDNIQEPVDTTPVTSENVADSDRARTALASSVSNLQELGNQAVNMPGTEFAGYTAPQDEIDNIAIADGKSYLTPETTVAGQLEKLLDKDSALSQQSRRAAREGASALGMMSSSTAVGDARARDVEALSPVAAQDAETAAKFKLQQQATENKIQEIQVEAEVSGALTVQKAEINEQATRVNQQWDAMIRASDAETQATLADFQAQLQKEQVQLEADLQRELSQQEIDAGMEQLIINNAQQSMNEYHMSVQQMLSNESFLDTFTDPALTAEENRANLDVFFNDMFVSVESSIRFNAQAAGVYGGPGYGMYDYINQLSADNQW